MRETPNVFPWHLFQARKGAQALRSLSPSGLPAGNKYSSPYFIAFPMESDTLDCVGDPSLLSVSFCHGPFFLSDLNLHPFHVADVYDPGDSLQLYRPHCWPFWNLQDTSPQTIGRTVRLSSREYPIALVQDAHNASWDKLGTQQG